MKKMSFLALGLVSSTLLADSTIRANQAIIKGANNAKLTHAQAIEHWGHKRTYIEYHLDIPKAGELKLFVKQANDKIHGTTYEVSLAGQKLRAKSINTNNWGNYQEDGIGSIEIKKPGKYTLTLKCVDFPKRALMNFKAIRFSGPASDNIKVLNKPERHMLDRKDLGPFDRLPGFGDKLKTKNPSFKYQDISPDFKQFRVSGIDFFADGRMAIGSWDAAGTVYILENSTAPKAQHKYKIFAQGLQEVLGLKIIDDQVYVVQKSELTRLDDTDNDGVADEYVCISNKWPVSTNFHEFTFGPLYKDGKFYVALAIAVNYGGATTKPQQQDRGTIIEIDPKTGDYRVMTAGLRTPNGLMMNSAGDMFVADNQGDYLPASKIMHIKNGAFYNHMYTPRHAFATKEISQPAAWLQQNEIGNSPTQGAFVPQGLYKDQLLIGDIHHGGLKRIFFEKIDGEYQTAIFRFTQGLRSGINRAAFDKQGNLYLGGAGVNNNWMTPGQNRDGLMRINLYESKQFEMLAIRAKSNGIEVEFTEPIKESDAWNKSLYKIKQWTYKPTNLYGGPKIDQEPLNVLSVTPDKELKKVFIEIEGMKEKHVIYLRLATLFQSKKGKELYSGDSFYTLNKIPQNNSGIFKAVPAHLNLKTIQVKKVVEHPGAEVYRMLCMSCHSLDGSKLVGPSFKGLASSLRSVIKNGKEEKVFADRAYLYRSIAEPAKEIAKGYQPIMPNLAANMSKKQVADIIDYMQSLGKQNTLSEEEKEAGWKSLFNGKDMNEWRNFKNKGELTKWLVEDGTMHMVSAGAGNIITKEKFTDFEFKMEWKISEGGNSGLFLKTSEIDNEPWKTAPEMQVLDNEKHPNGKWPKTSAGAIYGLFFPPKEAAKAAGQWNQVRVVVKGTHFLTFLNGVKTADFDTASQEWAYMVNKSKFKDFKNFAKIAEGHIGLQDHDDKVWYRNLKVLPYGQLK